VPVRRRLYYRLNPADPREYYDTTGTGNSLNAGHPVTLRLIMDSLRYWLATRFADPAAAGAPPWRAGDGVAVGPRSVLVLRGPRAARTAG
jgi:hypothetical protein